MTTHDLQLVRMVDAPVMTLSNGHLHIRPPRSQRQREAEAREAEGREALDAVSRGDAGETGEDDTEARDE